MDESDLWGWFGYMLGLVVDRLQCTELEGGFPFSKLLFDWNYLGIYIDGRLVISFWKLSKYYLSFYFFLIKLGLWCGNVCGFRCLHVYCFGCGMLLLFVLCILRFRMSFLIEIWLVPPLNWQFWWTFVFKL